VTALDAVLAKIQQVRQQGWCLVDQELEEGLISLAAPITNRAGRTIAAINISGQANRTDAKEAQEKLLPALLESARIISQRLI
jgi:IclR family pca regulon transcriptional regulator